MQPRIKLGLSIGAIGLVLNVCVSTAIGLCGPIVSIVAGATAGFLTAQQEKLPSKADGARAGAIAGGIAGGLVIIGQLIGSVLALVLLHTSDLPLTVGEVPAAGDLPSTITYYVAGLGTGVCIGLVGALLAAGAGAGSGYVGTSEQPTGDNSTSLSQ